jgi:purine-binding chemotaxis protein CheW
MTSDANSFLTMAVQGTVYAMPLARIREVVSCPSVVRVPNAGPSLRGVMNLRGSVIPVIDLACRLGFADTPTSSSTCALLMEPNGAGVDGDPTPFAALIEEIGTVMELQQDELLERPAFGLPVDPRLVRGVTPAGARFAIVLDLDELFEISQ